MMLESVPRAHPLDEALAESSDRPFWSVFDARAERSAAAYRPAAAADEAVHAAALH